jgi:hypothetical protein
LIARKIGSAISGIPSLATRGKTAALIGASRGWKRMNSGLARFSSTVYASVMVASAKRSTPADGSMTCGTKRSFGRVVHHGEGRFLAFGVLAVGR